MPFQILSIKHAIGLANDISAAVQNLTERVQTTEDPRPILDGVQQLLTIMQRADDHVTEGSFSDADFTQLGDYGIQLLADLRSWLERYAPNFSQANVQRVMIALTDWVIRHDGQLRTLEPIVDTLAELSNQSRSADELTTLTRFMGRVINACSEVIKNDLEKANPGRPWRILHLNYGITATRTHDVKLMREIFDRLVTTLPEDAARFFTEGIKEMERLNYPQHVRTVMREYFEHWAQRTMH